MATKKETSVHAYAVAGIVILVALIAMVLTIKIVGPAQTSLANLLGNAGEKIVTNPNTPPVTLANIGDTFYQGTVSLTLTATAAGQASFDAVSGGTTTSYTVHLGDTVTVGDVTVTLMSATKMQAGFIVAQSAASCGITDGQTEMCRGSSACCGGACVPLPDCSTKSDGPVTLCGQRQFYCCSQQLSLVACGDLTTGGPPCTSAADCNVDCVAAPCPAYFCLNGHCTTLPPTKGGGPQ